MAPTIPAGRELRHQIKTARAAEARARREGRRASAVGYDSRNRRVVVDLTNGMQVAFPLALFPEVANAPLHVVKHVSLSPSGSGIEWTELDADYSVPGLLAWAAGAHASASALGRVGGSQRSDDKAAAARANGALGGRPRRRRTAATKSR